MAGLTKQEIREIKAFKKKADAIVARIATERDALRQLISDYQDIAESVEQFEEDFESAVDKLSELL